MPSLISIPLNLKNVFENCSSLSIISFPDEPPNMNSNIFANMNRNVIKEEGHLVYDIKLCLPFKKNYPNYDVNKTKVWNNILAIEPDNYFDVCIYAKDSKTNQTGFIVAIAVSSVVFVLIIVIVSVLYYMKNKKNQRLRAEIDEHILLSLSVVTDFG